MSWVRLGWVESGSVELCWVGLDYVRLGWGGELGSDGLSWCDGWVELTKVALAWFELSWEKVEWSWAGSGCNGLCWVEGESRGNVVG